MTMCVCCCKFRHALEKNKHKFTFEKFSNFNDCIQKKPSLQTCWYANCLTFGPFNRFRYNDLQYISILRHYRTVFNTMLSCSVIFYFKFAIAAMTNRIRLSTPTLSCGISILFVKISSFKW